MVLMMAADGEIQDAELEQLQRAVADHRVFIELDHEGVETQVSEAFNHLIEHGLEARLKTLADELCDYRERLLAFALATRICFADGQIDASELALLKSLQQAFALTETHVAQITEAAQLPGSLDDIVSELHSARLVNQPSVEQAYIEIMLLMALADGEIQEAEGHALGLTLAKRVEFQGLDQDQLDQAIKEAIARIQGDGLQVRLTALNEVLSHQDERQRAIRFAYRILAADGIEDCRESGMLAKMLQAFELKDDFLEREVLLQVCE